MSISFSQFILQGRDLLHGGKSIFLGEGHRIDAKTPDGKVHETITVDTTVMSKYTVQSQTATYPCGPTVLPAARIKKRRGSSSHCAKACKYSLNVMIVVVVLGSVIEGLFAHSLPRTKTLNTSQQFKQAEAKAGRSCGLSCFG